MAGIDLTGDRRSQLLEMLLAKQVAPRQQPIRSTGELMARLGAQLIRQQQIKGLQGQEAQSQQQLVDALQAGQPTAPQAVTLEDFEGGSGRQQVVIPGKKAVPSERREAIRNLEDPAQQLAAMELVAKEKQLDEPGRREEIRLEAEARSQLQAQQDAAADRRLTEQLDASWRESEASRAATAEQNSYMRNLTRTEGAAERRSREAISELDRETKLLIATMQADAAGLDLSEAEMKAVGWYTSFRAGAEIIDQELAQGFSPSTYNVSVYAESVDPETPAWRKIQLRRLIPERSLNFLDATNMAVDPIVRMRTGAQVNRDEFIKTFNDVVPIGQDPTQIANKNFFRSQMLHSVGVLAGRGREGVDARFGGPIPPPIMAPQTIEGEVIQRPEAVDPNKPLDAGEQAELERLRRLEAAAQQRKDNQEVLR